MPPRVCLLYKKNWFIKCINKEHMHFNFIIFFIYDIFTNIFRSIILPVSSGACLWHKNTFVFCLTISAWLKCKGKAVPLHAWTGPECSRKLSFPDFVTMAQDDGRLSALHASLLYPRKYSWYLFVLQAESTPGPYCDRKDFMSLKNPLTSVGIEPETFRFVAQRLNHCATVVPPQHD